ncbi:MAG: hypothetical protein J6X38_04230 [Abditibacteriota bacterium]|nr:hypothetical protein [Abditibacteriota bacterium]
MKDGRDQDVKRSYAVGEIEINATGSKPPTPGPGWVLVAEVRQRRTGTSSQSSSFEFVRIPIARLKYSGGKLIPVAIDNDGDGADDVFKEANLGINNPLAIRPDSTVKKDWIAWPDDLKKPNRDDDEAHYNGNSVEETLSDNRRALRTDKLPVVDLGDVQHGTTSGEGLLGVMDRSAVGCKITRHTGGYPITEKLNNFRIGRYDLEWGGGADAITACGGIRFPWEQGPGSDDYPDIYVTAQNYRKMTDDANPSVGATTLPSVLLRRATGSGWDTQYPEAVNKVTGTSPVLRSEKVLVTVDVPKYQPANQTGYAHKMPAFIDSNKNGKFEDGNTILGRPGTYQEAYRRFRVYLTVPADPRMEVEEQTVDIGRVPHGLGLELDNFDAFCSDPDVQQWFKTITVKNTGNVNLRNLKVAGTDLYATSTNTVFPLSGKGITSSLDRGDRYMNAGKFPFRSQDGRGADIGYTLTKARVNSPDPSVMSIPDRRRWDMNFNGTVDRSENILSDLGWAWDAPLPIKVSVKVPLGQSTGSYMAPFLTVFSDIDGDGVVDRTEPYANPSFDLKVNVRESRLTGGVSPITLPQIDQELTPLKVNDTAPAAFKDAKTGDVHLFWSGNRQPGGNYPDFTDANSEALKKFASAPWFINHARLHWVSGTGWSPYKKTGDDASWWAPHKTNGNTVFDFGSQWPDLLIDNDNLSILKYEGENMVHHTDPYITVSESNEKEAWMTWTGSVALEDEDLDTVTNENRIFYGNISDISSNTTIPVRSILQDPYSLKKSPTLAVYDNTMWAMWQSGNGSRWSLQYSVNPVNGHPEKNWTTAKTLRTPDTLTSVGSPSAIYHRYTDNKGMMDVVYSGIAARTNNSDVMLTRYYTDYNNNDWAPDKIALPMPRVFAERLTRDTKYGFFTSKHIAWKRPGLGNDAVVDNRGGYDVTSDTADYPYVYVKFPAGYPKPGGGKLNAETWISATDGTVKGASNENGKPIDPTFDNEAGVYVYKYDENSLATDLLGEMLIDYAAGILRFTEPFHEVRSDDEVLAPEVYADYTPQTWRLTTGLGADNSPMAFIEQGGPYTSKYSVVRPGLGAGFRSGDPDVDRLWVLWRRADRAGDNGSIYYTSYRMGIDLAEVFIGQSGNSFYVNKGVPAIPMNEDGTVSDAANLTISGNSMSWEVDRTGRKIFFTTADERVLSMRETPYQTPTDGIRVSYKDIDGKTVSFTARDISWIKELPEQAMPTEGNVNEGSIYGFADFDYEGASASDPLLSSKIWIFWTSTRSGTSDLYWQTLSPRF